MRRKLFFFLEKLQVTRRERIAIGILVVVLTVLGFLNVYIEQKAHYDEAYYEELEQIFGERTRQHNLERDEIMARYQPELPPAEEIITQQVQPEANDTIPGENSTQVQNETENLVNINQADTAELQTLPGIGPAYAERIIAWRAENGEFKTAEQLLEIRGIGQRRLESIRPLITLSDDNSD
jgi:comEA protein